MKLRTLLATTPGRVAFLAGASIWLLGCAIPPVLGTMGVQPRAAAGFWMLFQVWVGPAGMLVMGVLGLTVQQLIIANVIPVGPVSTMLAVPVFLILPSIANGFAWAGLVRVIGWARTHSRPLFLLITVGVGAYFALMLTIILTTNVMAAQYMTR